MHTEDLKDWLRFQIEIQKAAYLNPDKTEDQQMQVRATWAAYEHVLAYIKRKDKVK